MNTCKAKKKKIICFQSHDDEISGKSENFFLFLFFFIFLFFLKSCTFWIILAREKNFSSRDEKNFACGAHFL